MKSIKISFFFLFFLFWAAAFELGSGFCLKNFGNPVDRIIHALRPDSDLLWRQRSKQSLKLWGKSVVLNEFGFRNSDSWNFSGAEGLLMLGPSSALGWGIEESESYSALLSEELKKRGKNTKALNASQIGFSSRQGLELSYKKEIAELNPKWVLIAYGVNDLDRYRFFGDNRLSDAQAFQLRKETPLSRKDTLPYTSSLFYLLTRLSGEMQAKVACGLAFVPKIRATPSEFASNMIELANLWKKRGAQTLLLTTPLFVKNTSTDPEASNRLYAESAKAAEEKRCQEARDLFQRARSEEAARVARDNAKQNALLLREAKINGIRIASIHEPLLLEEDFLDPVHPAASGHRKIAQKLLESLVAQP